MESTPDDRDRRDRALAEELARLRATHGALPERWSLEDVRLLIGVALGVEPGLAHWLEEIALRMADEIAREADQEAWRRLAGAALRSRREALLRAANGGDLSPEEFVDLAEDDALGREAVALTRESARARAAAAPDELDALLARVTPENRHAEQLNDAPRGRAKL